MRVPLIILLAIVGAISALPNCGDGSDSSGNPDLEACVIGEIARTRCTDQGCACTQMSHITACYSQYCGHVPAGVADKQSSVCFNDGGVSGGQSQLSPISYLGTTATASLTSASPDSASGVSAPAATSMVTVVSNTTSSVTAASAPTVPPATTAASKSTEPPTHTVSEPPTPISTGAAQPAASKAAANLGFIAPAGGVLAAVIGILAYL